MVLAALAAYAAAVNLWAFALFGIDKRRAETAGWRIRESTLLTAAVLGGWPGAKAGQRRFRHKTRKQPFADRLDALGWVWGGTVVIALSLASWPAPTAGGAGGGAGAGGGGLGAAAAGVRAWAEGWAEVLVPPEEPRLPRRFGPGSDLRP